MTATQDDGPIDLPRVLLDEYRHMHGEPDPPIDAGDPDRGAVLRAVNQLLCGRVRSALCLSGGGIRSATFALGVLEGLAAKNILPRIHYLSTVSGGGYIGSWLTAWCAREQGISGVAEKLRRIELAPIKRASLDEDELPLQRAPAPVRYLRRYSNFLTPKLGALSADTWTGIATYLRNLGLHWLLLVPPLLLVILLPQAIAAWLAATSTSSAQCASIGLAVAFVGVVVALGFITVNRPSNGSRHDGQGAFLVLCLLPVCIAALSLAIAWDFYPNRESAGLYWFVAIGALIRVVAWAASLYLRSRSEKATKQAIHCSAAEFAFAALSGCAGGIIVWFLATHVFPDGTADPVHTVLFVCLAPVAVLVSFLVADTLFIALVSFCTEEEDREWWARSGGWVLIACVGWVALTAPAIVGPAIVHYLLAYSPSILASIGGIGVLTGPVTALLGRSASELLNTDERPQSAGQSLVRNLSFILLPAVFLLALTILLAFAVNWAVVTRDASPANTANLPTETALALGRDEVANVCAAATAACTAGARAEEQKLCETLQPHCSKPVLPPIDAALRAALSIDGDRALVAALVLFAAFLVTGWCININRFSMHATYRMRLIRAYLGASNTKRKPNPFTGLDPKDNLQMHDLLPMRLEDGRLQYPFHIVNLCLNLVGGADLAWQQRKGASFTASSLHCGSWVVDYRPSRRYGGADDGLSLGTAVAVSGAAASPNMGYHSSPVVSLIMTLFNVRLGWWLGNPENDGTWQRQGPKFAPVWLLAEAFGLTNKKRRYVYLSDGGHFDNLGLYEMVLRRCRLIVVSDASADCDYEFFDLGMAIRKIRIDLGIEIDMGSLPALEARDTLRATPEGTPKRRYGAVGRIRYPESRTPEEDGILIYLKPGCHNDMPADVLDYALTHEAFPHDNTADQWFDEAQFESYRRLGQHVVEQVFAGVNIPQVRSGPLMETDLSSVIAAFGLPKR